LRTEGGDLGCNEFVFVKSKTSRQISQASCCDNQEVTKFIIAGLLCGWLLPAQSGRQVVPPKSLHQYSGISPLSANNDKLHTFDSEGRARIVRFRDVSVIADSAPFPEAHWDNADDDLMWLIGAGGNHSKNRIETWRPSTGKYQTVIDYRGRFSAIGTGSTSDLTYDWEAFYASAEHQVCAVDLKAKKTYCIDYNAPDPVNKMGDMKDVDWVAVTPRDSKSGLHYVVMIATPAGAVFSVDESAGVLRWVIRGPEAVYPWMGNQKAQNNDGNCDPGETCLTTPHGDIFVALDGQVYFEALDGIEDGKGICQTGPGLMRLNAGLKMSTPENYAGVSGGGLKLGPVDFHCGGGEVWSSQHTGCNRWGGHCVVSFDTPIPQSGQATPRKNELWLIGVDGAGSITYTRAGASSSSFVNAGPSADANYWSSSRAAMSMDGTQIIFDSDAGSNGAHHAVYSLPTGLPPVQRPPVK